MFELIISNVRSGKVQRHYFGSRDEAEGYLARWEDKLMNPTRANARIPSLREFRTEIYYRETPTLLSMPRSSVAATAAA